MVQPIPVHRDGQLTSGFWGNHTSTIDWCESNYVHTHFIAETYNTLSNIPFVVLAVVGAISVLCPNGAYKPLPHARRFMFMHALLALVGTGSFVFHATLKWSAQVMLDEMPMLLLTCAALYSVRVPIRPDALRPVFDLDTTARKVGTTTPLSQIEDPHFWLRLRWRIIMPLFGFGACVAYLHLPLPLLHQVTFACLMCLNGLVVIGLLAHPNLKMPLPISSPKATSPIDQPQVQTAGNVVVRTLVYGLIIFNTGFAIWVADNIFCDSLGRVREWAAGNDAGLMGIITQGHAWWHLLTGLGANWLIVGLTYLRLAVSDPLAFEVAHYWGCVPYVRWREGPSEQVEKPASK